jgi:hypothetical protein
MTHIPKATNLAWFAADVRGSGGTVGPSFWPSIEPFGYLGAPFDANHPSISQESMFSANVPGFGQSI